MVEALMSQAAWKHQNIKICHEENNATIFYLTQPSFLIFYIIAVNKHKAFLYSTPIWFRHQKKLSKCSYPGIVYDRYISWLFLKFQNCWNSASSLLHQLLIDILSLSCLISPCSMLLSSQKHISAVNDSASREKCRKPFICLELGIRYAGKLICIFFFFLVAAPPF